jgi:PAS domain S-box-containing protein
MRYSIYNHISDGVIIVEDGVIKYINDRSCRLFGISCREAHGERFDSVFRDTSLLNMKEYQEKSEVLGNRIVTIKKIPQNSSNGNNFIIICQDITLLEEIGQHVYEHSADFNGWLKKMIESATDGLTIVDNQGVIVWNNHACEGIFGAKRSDVVNKHVSVLKRERLINQSVSLKVLSKREPASVHHITRVKNQILSTGVPVFNRRGDIVFVSVLSRDMAHLKALEMCCMTKKPLKLHSDKNIIEEKEIAKKLNQRGFVLKSPKMLELLPPIMEATKSESTVLLCGEAGVGKEAIARLIHDLGPRAHKPFVHLNCSEIPGELIESLLFGYEPGAFRGDWKDGKKGLIEAAEMGTLYIEDISGLELSLQGRLLRTLQEYAVRRIGGRGAVKVNVRIVASSSRDIKAMVGKREFRADLFYKLSVVPVHVPPLRERMEDIQELLLQNLRLFNKQYKKNVSFSNRAVSLLSLYHWPGNIDQLINTVESSVAMARTPIVKMRDLNIDYSLEHEQGLDTLNEIVKKAEKDHLLKAVCLYSSTHKIARVLGVSQPTVVRKMRKHFHGGKFSLEEILEKEKE